MLLSIVPNFMKLSLEICKMLESVIHFSLVPMKVVEKKEWERYLQAETSAKLGIEMSFVKLGLK